MRWTVAGIGFDHMHMGDNLQMAFDHPHVEIVALCDEQPRRMEAAAKRFGMPSSRLFSDEKQLFNAVKPDIVLLCPSTARHAEWVRRVAPFGVHLLVEKPFAASLADAD